MPIPLRMAVFWNIYKVLERAPVLSQPPEKVRRESNRRAWAQRLPGAWVLTGRPDSSVAISDSSMQLDDGTELGLRIYRPKLVGDGKPPVVLNFHGGGWVSGDLQHSQWWCAGIAAGTGAVVVSVDYRLAPEFPFPIPAEDCYAATKWVVDNADELGVDADRLAVMGDSAGGNLAAVVCVMARDRGGPPIRLQVLIYPSVAAGADYPSKYENADAPILTRKDIENTPLLYTHGTSADFKDPYLSPLYADHHDLPPALIQTAQYDPLRDHGPAYAAALRDAGVEVRLTNYIDAVHGYASLPRLVPAAHQALTEAVEALRARL